MPVYEEENKEVLEPPKPQIVYENIEDASENKLNKPHILIALQILELENKQGNLINIIHLYL